MCVCFVSAVPLRICVLGRVCCVSVCGYCDCVFVRESNVQGEGKSKFTTSKAGRSSDEMRSTVSSEGDGSHLSPLESDNCMHISISKFYTHELSLTARKQTRISIAQTARGRRRGTGRSGVTRHRCRSDGHRCT